MIASFQDSYTNLLCIIDTGSPFSLFPQFNINGEYTSVSFYNGTRILPLYELIEKTIGIGQNNYTWQFHTANIDHIILGADFIAAHGSFQ